MLIYVGTGERNYGQQPVKINARRAWEFQAVLRGKIGPLFAKEPEPLDGTCLWIFPPGHLHGWTGERRRAAEVAVFHFLSVPELLSRLLPREGYFRIPLSPSQLKQIRELVQKVHGYWTMPSQGMMICYEHALMSLSLIAAEAAAHSTAAKNNYPQNRVNAAMVWYAQRIEENPRLPEIARAAGVSPAHLRRLFHEVLQASPNQIMDQLRFQRAIQLMSDPAVKLETIGFQCGFGSASTFSRAFKAKFGCSPQAWRPSTLHNGTN